MLCIVKFFYANLWISQVVFVQHGRSKVFRICLNHAVWFYNTESDVILKIFMWLIKICDYECCHPSFINNFLYLKQNEEIYKVPKAIINLWKTFFYFLNAYCSCLFYKLKIVSHNLYCPLALNNYGLQISNLMVNKLCWAKDILTNNLINLWIF